MIVIGRLTCQDTRMSTVRLDGVECTRDSSVGIIKKRFALRSKLLKLMQHITSTEKVLRFEFWANMTDRTAKDLSFLSKICSSEEETFYLCEKVGRPNIRIWGCECRHAVVEHLRNSPKTNVFSALSCDKVNGKFFFREKSRISR